MLIGAGAMSSTGVDLRTLGDLLLSGSTEENVEMFITLFKEAADLDGNLGDELD